jgi:hypothetical protein
MSIEPRVPEFPICDPGLLAVVGANALDGTPHLVPAM